MTFALDASYSIGSELSGVGVYSRELLAGLAALDPHAAWTWAYRPHHWRTRFFGPPVPAGARRRLLWESRPPGRCDLFHGLNQRLPAFCGTPPHRRAGLRTVATFHDLFMMSREYSTAGFRSRFTEQATLAAERADAVIAVSAFTGSQVQAMLGVEPARIHVVHHGVRPLPPPSGPTPAREPVVLSVGALQVRKNTLGLIRAFERLPEGWRLILAGSLQGFGAPELRAAVEASSKRSSIDLRGWVSDAELAGLYARASIFAFPSLDEGFGIPVLEAMANGVAVMASNTSALPEVCGDAALLVDPQDLDAMAGALERLMQQDGLRHELIVRGRQRAASFTWERCARETLAVYRKLTE
ncbi:MAG: glycosyltransferase family 4 protein [Bryobacterales bacterium]|nr:glycosyltransferase family 4 protein [Bryobacterales bacterium]